MMNKTELTTLVDALKFNTRILNGKLGEKELIMNNLLELQETISVQLNVLEEELEKVNLIDEEKWLDTEDEDNRQTLRVGDYISEPNLEDKYSKGDYVLFQVIRQGDKYTRLFIERLIVDNKLYDTIDDLKKDLHKDAYFYYIDDDFGFTEGRYLVYNQECGGDYEIKVSFEEEKDKYTILIAGANDYFGDECEEGFDTLEEVENYLRKDYSLIKKLRYSIHY